MYVLIELVRRTSSLLLCRLDSEHTADNRQPLAQYVKIDLKKTGSADHA